MRGGYDVVVLGLGAVGCAAAFQLAQRGRSVLGIDRHHPPHNFGSSHGETRVTRTAIGEGIEYTPFALRSNELWREIEGRAKTSLLVQCGFLAVTGGGDAMRNVPGFFENTKRAAEKHSIPLRIFASGQAIRLNFPQFVVRDDDRAFLDEWGGFLYPEACIREQLKLAVNCGAKLKTGTRATFKASSSGVRVRCDNGAEYEADRLLITAGPWIPQFLSKEYRKKFKVTRQTVYWFEVVDNVERFDVKRCPVFVLNSEGRGGATSNVYGFPIIDNVRDRIKIAHEEEDVEPTDPENVRREVTQAEIEHMYSTYVQPYLPGLGPKVLKSEVCLYTRVKGARFVIDYHPEYERVMFASACSGHGFKHSAAIGEAIAQRLVDGHATLNLERFSLRQIEDY